uniref:Cytochrome P450 n=3 Tax=Photinus pyralis TaxID=7054 RepID=A0A1Y1M1H3_PHOPY
MWFLILVAFISLLVYLSIFKVNTYWTRKCVPQLTPLPLIGNMGSIILRKKEVSHITQEIYNSFPNSRYIGIYQFRKPTLFVRDPELIRQITIKCFNNFPEHSLFNNDENDVPKNKGLFSLGAKSGWHDMRKRLNGGFTPNKMKDMFGIINESVDTLVEYLSEREGAGVDSRELFTRLNCNVILNTMFGIECNCLKEPPHKLFSMGNEINDYSSWKFVRIFATTISMTLTKLLDINLVRGELFVHFMQAIKGSLRERERNKTFRGDMVDFMLDNKGETDDEPSAKKINLNEDEKAMQLFGFFIGGYDAISALLAYSSYELAVNPDIQRRLREEVEGVTHLTYESLMNMKYLDMVVSEVLRKWPIAVFIDRKCMEQFVIQPEHANEAELILEPGILCWIPIYAIHRDPKYYPEPEKFDPERFSEKNKHQINRSVYFPFGAGPRTCIGELLCYFPPLTENF